MKGILLLMLLLGRLNITNACDCDSLIGKKDAKSAFKGTVYSINRIDSDFVRYEVVFEIHRKMKGHIKGRKITVNVSCLMDACCGVSFKEGDSYIIYTFIRNGMVYTSACTMNVKLRDRRPA
jgi:hypothetical protein